MARPSNQMYIMRRSLLSRSRIFHPPSALLHATVKYTTERRKDQPSQTKLSEFLTGGIKVPALRNVDRKSPKYAGYIERVRESFIGQFALAAGKNASIHDFLNAHTYVIIDNKGHITGTNTRLLGMGSLRIPTEDIKWLINHLD